MLIGGFCQVHVIMQVMAMMVESPYLAIVPAGIFYFLFSGSGNRFILAVAVLWLLYLLYEYGIKLRILCSGDCAIRVDLLLLYPGLLLLSVAALVVFVIHKSSSRD